MGIDQYLDLHKECINDDFVDDTFDYQKGNEVENLILSSNWLKQAFTVLIDKNFPYGNVSNDYTMEIKINEHIKNMEEMYPRKILTKDKLEAEGKKWYETYQKSIDPITAHKTVCLKDYLLCAIYENAINTGASAGEGLLETEDSESIGDSTLQKVDEKIKKSIEALQ
jgi:hypothetical protein